MNRSILINEQILSKMQAIVLCIAFQKKEKKNTTYFHFFELLHTLLVKSK